MSRLSKCWNHQYFLYCRRKTRKNKGNKGQASQVQQKTSHDASSYGFRNKFISAHQKAGIKAQKPERVILLHEEWYLTAMQGGLPWDKPLSVRSSFTSVTKTQSTAEYPTHHHSQLPVQTPAVPQGDAEQENRTHHGDGGVELGDAHPAGRVLAVEAFVGEAAAVAGLHRRLRGVRVQVNQLLTCHRGNHTSTARTTPEVRSGERGGRAMAEPAPISTRRNPHSRHILLSAISTDAPQPGTAASTTTAATPL